MSWETISLVGIVIGGGLGVLGLVVAAIVATSFIRRMKARPAKGKAKTKEKAADEGYSKRDQSLLAEMSERLAVLEADTTLKLDNFHRRLLGLTRGRQDSEGRGPIRGGNHGDERSGGDPEWERVDPNDPAVAAAIAAGEYVTPDGQPVAVGEEELPRRVPGDSKEERLAHLRARGPVRR